MAELSASDKMVLLGPDYKEPEVTVASLADKSRKRRNLAIGAIVVAAVILVVILYGSQGIAPQV